jgi:hypothetical protein
MCSPKIVSNHTIDTSTPETIVDSIIKPGMTSEEKALAIWRFCWKHTYHWPAPKEDGRSNHELDVVFDALKQLNVYGYTYCFAIRSLGEALYEAAGMEARSCGIGGHVLGEVYFDGKYHLLDHEQRGFSRMPDGVIASLADYRGHARDLILNPTGPSRPFFPAGKAPKVPYEQKLIITGYLLNHGLHYYQHDKYRTTHSMNIGLRPGERFIRGWGNIGKWHWIPGLTAAYKNDSYGDPWKGPCDRYTDLYEEAPRDEDGKPLTFANGLMIYRPDLGSGRQDYRDGVYREENIDSAGSGFGPRERGRSASADFRVRLPYVIVGWPGDIDAEKPKIRGAAVVSAHIFRRAEADSVRILVSTDDGTKWTPVWSATETGEFDMTADLSRWVEGKYVYLVRFELRTADKPQDARIVRLGIDTACQLNSAVLPAVRSGLNRMTVTSDAGPDVYDETIHYAGPYMATHTRLVREITGLQLDHGTYATLAPARGEEGHVVYELAAPPESSILWAKIGGAFRSHRSVIADDQYRIYYAFGQPHDWKLLWQADPAPYLSHWCFESNHEIPVSGHVERVFVKYVLRRSSARGSDGGKLVGTRFVWGCAKGANAMPRGGVKITHAYTEDGVAREQTRIVTGDREAYEFDVVGKDVRNTAITIEWADRAPAAEGPHPLMLERPVVEPREIRNMDAVHSMWQALKKLDAEPELETAIDIMWNCKHTWTHNAVVAALMTFGGDRAREELKKAVGKRGWAQGCLLELLAQEGPTEDLLAYFTKADHRGRAQLAELFAVRRDLAVLDALREAIAKEDTKDTLALEVATLLLIGGADLADEAAAQLANCRLDGKVKVAAALAAIGDARGFAILEEAMRCPDRYIRFRAATGLAESRHPAAEAGLVGALEDDSRWVRQAATSGLAKCGGKHSATPLVKMAKEDPLPYLRAEADWALRQIRKRTVD